MRRYDLLNQKFGKLLVIGEGVRGAKGRRWRCRCDCGKEADVYPTRLVTGSTRSCGCLRSEVIARRNRENSPSRKYSDATTSTRNTVIYGYKRAAAKRAIKWELTLEQCVFLLTSDCYYCGSHPSNTCQMYGGTGKPLTPYSYNGIDRKNNELGYLPGNVVPACAICNRAKRDMPLEVFLDWIERVRLRSFSLKDP